MAKQVLGPLGTEKVTLFNALGCLGHFCIRTLASYSWGSNIYIFHAYATLLTRYDPIGQIVNPSNRPSTPGGHHFGASRVTDNTSAVTDWIGGMCPAHTLLVWFPAHWAPIVMKAVHDREEQYRDEHPLWFDEVDLLKEARCFQTYQNIV